MITGDGVKKNDLKRFSYSTCHVFIEVCRPPWDVRDGQQLNLHGSLWCD
jgi:hypothetical protein